MALIETTCDSRNG